MRENLKGTNTEVINWLLETENPSVRYLALRHMLGWSEEDPDVQTARAAIPASQRVKRIFAKQDSNGFWGDPESPYLPKYTASYWTLMVLGYLRLRKEDEGASKAADSRSAERKAPVASTSCWPAEGVPAGEA